MAADLVLSFSRGLRSPSSNSLRLYPNYERKFAEQTANEASRCAQAGSIIVRAWK